MQSLSEYVKTRNPFQNPTENISYSSDYSQIVPQVTHPLCKIPLFPSTAEKNAIRSFYNRGGLLLLLQLMVSNVIAILLYFIATLITTSVDTASLSGNLPENYQDILTSYLNEGSSVLYGINLTSFLIANVLVFFVGCKILRLRPSDFFQTKSLTIGLMFSYIMIGLFLQYIAGMSSLGIEYLLNGIGYTATTPDSAQSDTILQTLLSIVYGVIVAPITEELVYRGVFLKCMSKVSQRFGIFVSALFFGMGHQNLPQFILAFSVGIFLSYIVTKHNSLLPSILVHMAVNFFGVMMTLAEQWNEELANGVYFLCLLFILFVGGYFFFRILLRERLPMYMPHQQVRSFSIAITSFGLILCFLLDFLFMIFSIQTYTP